MATNQQISAMPVQAIVTTAPTAPTQQYATPALSTTIYILINVHNNVLMDTLPTSAKEHVIYAIAIAFFAAAPLRIVVSVCPATTCLIILAVHSAVTGHTITIKVGPVPHVQVTFVHIA